MYEWEPVEVQTRIEQLRQQYVRYGLYIFESFEEYCEDKVEDEH